MELIVRRGSAGLDVRDIEYVRVGPARELHRQDLPDRRRGAITAREERSLKRLFGAIRSFQHGPDAVIVLHEPEQLGRAFDVHALLGQFPDKQLLMLILRVHEHEGECGLAPSNLQQGQARGLRPLDPKIHPARLDPACDDGLGDSQLPVEFKRPGVHPQRARGCPRFVGLVDDPDADAQMS